jgi:alanine dehydrogenase
MPARIPIWMDEVHYRPVSTIILSRSDIAELLDYDSCIDAVENAFRLAAEDTTIPPSVLGTHVPGGGFHIKSAGMQGDRPYYAAKINANFPANPSLRGLPTIQGVLCLYDASDGRLLALMDSMEITSIRTAAATAVAARHLARPNSHTVTIIGCGNQGRSQLRALSRVMTLDKAFAFDSNAYLSSTYSEEMSTALRCDVTAVDDYHASLSESDIVVTCTPSQVPLLNASDIAPGTFIAAVGADSEAKHEISADLMKAGTVVVDVLGQCAEIGDLHHAVAAGSMSLDDVHAELQDVVSGRKPGRTSDDQIIIFDSTGTALEDVAAAALVYNRSLSLNRGMQIDFGA